MMMRLRTRSHAVLTATTIIMALALVLGLNPQSAVAAPAAPSGLRSTAQSPNALTMAWNAVPGAVGYRLVYSAKSDMSSPRFLNLASGLSGSFGELNPSTTYFVKVRALDAAGANYSSYSSAVTAKTSTAEGAAPTGVKASAQSTTTLTFSWAAVPNAPGYRIALSKNADMSSPTYLNTTGNSGEARGLSPASDYYARVRVIAATGEGITPYSTIAKATTATVPVLPPVAKPLSVASYNVHCATCNDGNPEEKTWAERRGSVVQTIISKKPDIIGIQEASKSWLDDPRPGGYTQFEDLRDRLSNAGIAYKATNSHRNNCVDSSRPTNCQYFDQGASSNTRILYNPAAIKMIRSGSKALPAASGAESTRFVAWAEVVQLSSGKKFFFANAHLEIGKDSKANDLRKVQAAAVMDTITTANSAGLPVILVGDMNSHKWTYPANGPYDVFTGKGLVDPLGNTYKNWYPSGEATAEKVVNRRLYSWNGFERLIRQGAVGTSGIYLDYIFTSKMRVSYYENVAKFDSAGNHIGIMASDHNMQYAVVGLP